jgi:hypothetical protein
VAVAVPQAATHVRLEADVAIAEGGTHTVGAFGYASAEVILHLKLLDGATLLTEQRLSLKRSVSAVCTWDDKRIAAGTQSLALDYARPGGAATDVTYSAEVEVEIWAGVGAAGYAEGAIRCTVEAFRVLTAC